MPLLTDWYPCSVSWLRSSRTNLTWLERTYWRRWLCAGGVWLRRRSGCTRSGPAPCRHCYVTRATTLQTTATCAQLKDELVDRAATFSTVVELVRVWWSVWIKIDFSPRVHIYFWVSILKCYIKDSIMTFWALNHCDYNYLKLMIILALAASDDYKL